MLMEAGGQPQRRSHLVRAATASASAWLQAERPAIGRLSALLDRSQKKTLRPRPGTERPSVGQRTRCLFRLSTWPLSGQVRLTTSPMHC